MTAESVTTQIWVVILIGRTAREIFFSQSEALPRSVINVEFLQSFLRRHFSGGETNGSVPKCQVFAQTRAMYDIYFSSLKIFHLHFFAWQRNYFCFYVFFGIGRKQLQLEVCRIDRSWQCDALAWFTNSATTTLHCWNTHALGQVRKEKNHSCCLWPAQFWEANQCISEQMVPLYCSRKVEQGQASFIWDVV